MEALVIPAMWIAWKFSELVEHIKKHGFEKPRT